MGWAYVPTHTLTRGLLALPISVARWFALMSTDVDPHFPTIYAITRLGADAVHFDGIPLEYFVRAPIVLALSFLGASFIRICVKGPPDGTGALVAASIILILVLDGHWREHSAEARMYGLMSVLGIAMLCAIQDGRLLIACWLGLALALLHPFGAMFGFAPAVVTLVLFRRHLSRPASLGILAGLTVSIALVCGWMLLKFVLKSSSGFTVGGRSDDILKVLTGLNLYATVAVGLLTAASLAVFRAKGGAEFQASILFLAIPASAAMAIGLLFIMKPSTPPYERYIRWANPVLFAMAAIYVAMLARRVLPKLLRVAALPLTLCASVAAVAVARAEPFGPPWGNALREAALYLNAVADNTSVVTHDTFEIFDFPPWFRTGFRCFRGGQSVPYLSPAVRERMPCQAGNDVAIPDGVRQVYVIREPIAWVGPRRIHLEAFDKVTTLPFGNAAIDLYHRRAD